MTANIKLTLRILPVETSHAQTWGNRNRQS